jgi:hypothetical protein
MADSHTRASIWDAIYHRTVYATTGERIYLEFAINGQPMGSEIDNGTAATIEARAIGTDVIERVDVVKYDGTGGWRNLYEAAPGNFFWDDVIVDSGLSENSLYYLRITQEDGHMAWSSPIWVDAGMTGKQARRTRVPHQASHLHSLGYLE